MNEHKRTEPSSVGATTQCKDKELPLYFYEVYCMSVRLTIYGLQTIWAVMPVTRTDLMSAVLDATETRVFRETLKDWHF